MNPPRSLESAEPVDEDWARIRAAFERLVDLDDAARERALAELERDAPAVASEVRALLGHDREGFLEQPLALPGPELAPGATLGGFRLVRRIGAGGMGEVWEARQSAPDRSVALKVLPSRLGSVDPRERLRFDLEAEALSRLQHPGIAQVYGAGAEPLHGEATGAEGAAADAVRGGDVPWIAMELLEGARDLLTFARAERLDVPARLALFDQLCAAVAHGHRRGVLHRDIKPANVLVIGTAEAPVVKLIDFGIARLQDAQVQGLERTRTGELVGTLAYMAPERLASGGGHDVRTDVYALGVLLYRLLSGRFPIPQEDTDLPRLVRDLARSEPTPLSAHDPRLAGDLEWVVAMALERDPAQRYPTVEALAADLRRVRAHEPTLAGPQTRRRAVAKFLRRNRLACAVAGAFAALLVAALVGVTLALLEARHQERLAQKEDAKNAVVQSLIDELFFGVSDTRSGRDVRVLDLVDAFAADFESGEHAVEVELRFRTVLGGMHHTLHSYARAEEELSRAWELAREHPGLDPKSEQEAQALLGSTRIETGRRAEGLELLQEALEKARRTPELGLELDFLLLALKHHNREAEHEETLAVATRCLELAPDSVEVGAHRSATEFRGIALMGLGRAEEALELLEGHQARLEAAFGLDHHRSVAPLSALAVAVQRVRGPEAAEPALARAVEACARVYGPTATHTLTAHNNYGNMLSAVSRHEEAREQFRRALDGYSQMEAPPLVDRLRTLTSHGMTYRNAGDFEAALPDLRTAVEEAAEAFGEDDWNLAIFRLNLGSCLGHLRRLDEAEPLMLMAWDVLRYDPDGPGVRHRALRSIAKMYELNGRGEDRRFWREQLEADPDWPAQDP